MAETDGTPCDRARASAPSGVRPGLCSVTYRTESVETVVRAAAEAGLAAIEWGADVHAPPDDEARLEHCRALTQRHGLAVASYGTYWRAGESSIATGRQLLDAATRLGAPRVRVWAGVVGSAEASAQQRRQVTDAVRALGLEAAGRGIEVGLEYHPRTLTDTADSTLCLLDDVGHPAVRTYWQPAPGDPDEIALATLDAVLDRLCAVHVFSWWPGIERIPLQGRESLWRSVIERLTNAGRPIDALVEFVPDDDLRILTREASSLDGWISSGGRR